LSAKVVTPDREDTADSADTRLRRGLGGEDVVHGTGKTNSRTGELGGGPGVLN
jgi:hypothetical protein